MNINMTIPDASSGEVLDGIAQATGWTTESGKTKAQWAKEKLAQWVKETTKRGLLKTSQADIGAAIDPITIT